MKKIDLIYNEMLYNYYELKNKKLTQNYLAKRLKVSLSTVNNALKPLVSINTIEVNPMNFIITDAHKILLYWATKRKLKSEIFYKTRFEDNISNIEKNMPDDIIFAAFSAYKLRFSEIPADYSEVYVYSEKDCKKRFPERKGTANVFFLKKDKIMDSYGKMTTLAQTFVDLWNINTWYAQEFLKALEKKMEG